MCLMRARAVRGCACACERVRTVWVCVCACAHGVGVSVRVCVGVCTAYHMSACALLSAPTRMGSEFGLCMRASTYTMPRSASMCVCARVCARAQAGVCVCVRGRTRAPTLYGCVHAACVGVGVQKDCVHLNVCVCARAVGGMIDGRVFV